MGVPSFYRWLAEKYPLIVQDVIEEEPVEISGVKLPVDTSKPNPNDIEYDNLYLDMNGIIHPCFHPEDMPSPTTFSEVFQCMFDYIDRLFAMVRPRKLLYMAIDGVAPRAKMNQQRSRRFRAAKDAAEAAAEEERLREEFEREGRKLPPKVNSQVFDSNVITPGTEFMFTLSVALKYYIHLRLNYAPGWKNIKVILSDANVPGEGEHKIMSYIRLQRNLPGYDPNTRHCLYGLDADLIMLGLATHEVHFAILREIVFTAGQDKCYRCGEVGHRAANCRIKAKRKAKEFDSKTDASAAGKKPYQFLNIWTLREYLEHDMQIPNPPYEIDLERIVDDFVFICFFVGNDFLPHMPTLEIREGAIELLMSVYKNEFRSFGGYLSKASKLNLKKVEHFIQAVGSYENSIFQKRSRLHQRQAQRIMRGNALTSGKYHGSRLASALQPSAYKENIDVAHPQKVRRLALEDNVNVGSVDTDTNHETEACNVSKEELENEEELKFNLKKLLQNKTDTFSSGNAENDMVRLGEPGWRERYYEQKFSAKTVEEMEKIRRDVVAKYTEGLCWVMHYYYGGVCSWKWFYPYHYAPFASDLKDLDQLDIKFELGSPFKPFNQLLGVLPAASAHALPECFRTLMTDPNSPIRDFYPADFEVDMNGKRYSWQGIAKLPFIEEHRLLDAIAQLEHTSTKEEIRRNRFICDMIFMSASHPLAEVIRTLENRCKTLAGRRRRKITEKIDPELSDGLNGYLALCSGESQSPSFSSPIKGMKDILANEVICTTYKLPDQHKHVARPPAGVVFPEKMVNASDLVSKSATWHEDVVRSKRNNPPGSISGVQLREAALKLVRRSIQPRPNHTDVNSETNPSALRPTSVFQNGGDWKRVLPFPCLRLTA